MKYIILIYIFLFCSCLHDKQYCGTIIEKGYDQPSSGYKSHTDPNYFIIINVDSINTGIRIEVTVPTWYSVSKGQRICFILNEMQLMNYGNGNKHLIK